MTFYIGSLKRRRSIVSKLLKPFGVETRRGSRRKLKVDLCSDRRGIEIEIPGVYGGRFYETIRVGGS